MSDSVRPHPYATLEYARTLEHVGTPRFVPEWGTYVLQRHVSDEHEDAFGVYPLAMMNSSADIGAGLDDLRGSGVVSIVLVSDHLGGPLASAFQRPFSLARDFKQHFVVDRSAGHYQPSEHHRARIQRATRRGVVVRWVELSEVLEGWVALYDELIERRGIEGAPQFTRHSFDALAKCGGLRVAGAFMGDSLVGCHLWFCHGDTAWSHLAATNELGRKNSAAFALYDFSINSIECSVVSLGGGAGLVASSDDGLAAFKRGFANHQIIARLYGAILLPRIYQQLCHQASIGDTEFFPAYRSKTTDQLSI